MLKPLIAGITAISLTLGSAAPLQAQGMNREDMGKLLIGLAAVAVIGAAIDDHRERERNTPAHDNREWSGINRDNDWSLLNRQHQANRDQRRILPHACLRSVDTRFGTQRIFGQHCLEQNYRHLSRLPDRCAVRLYTNAGPARGYDPLCLREQGYRTDRRH